MCCVVWLLSTLVSSRCLTSFLAVGLVGGSFSFGSTVASTASDFFAVAADCAFSCLEEVVILVDLEALDTSSGASLMVGTVPVLLPAFVLSVNEEARRAMEINASVSIVSIVPSDIALTGERGEFSTSM